MSNVYYWDFKIDYNKQPAIECGLVLANGSNAQNLNGDCTMTSYGLTYDKFTQGDLVNVNIYDDTSGGDRYMLVYGDITFTSGTNGSSPFDPAQSIFKFSNLNQWESPGGKSAVFGEPYPYWVGLSNLQVVVDHGKFNFVVNLQVKNSAGYPGYFRVDPEMIVGGATR